MAGTQYRDGSFSLKGQKGPGFHAQNCHKQNGETSAAGVQAYTGE